VADPAPAKILVVEDEPANRYVLVRHLRKAGFNVIEAATGAEGLQRLEEMPDLVILDVRLPDFDGREICRMIKSSPRTAQVMVLHASATFASTEDRVLGLEGGADGYLTYPLDLAELVANVRALLRIRQAEQQARMAARHLETTFSAINDGVALVDAEGRVLRCNPAMAGFLGCAVGEILGKCFQSVVHSALGPVEVPPVPDAGQGGRRSREVQAGERWFLMLADPVRDESGDASGAVYVLTDITERKLLDAELCRRTEELASANRAKDEFLAMLGHELRNPLAPILNAVTILREETRDGEARERAREVMERQVHHMARLLDDLLDVSRINRGTIELRRAVLDLTQVANLAAQHARVLMDARQHRFHVILPSEPIWVHADSTRLEQVLYNLLSNAAKYTPPGGSIRLVCERDGDTAVLTVRDNGRGIPAAMLGNIFDLFTQVSPTLDRSLGGLGLGLTLVRRLVEMHDGTVVATSEGEGRGAEFTVRLPTVPTPSQPAEREAEPASTAPGAMRVLIVEDNDDSRETLQDLLALWGHDVTVASDGVSGLRALKEALPDIALIDIGLPGIDGYELSRQIRALRGGEKVRLVALTGYGQPEDRARALSAGFDDHMVKPLEPEKLRRLLTPSASRNTYERCPSSNK
jgi:PAS domain S-box-containing protein